MAGDRSDQDCVRHHAVLRESGFMPSVSLTFRGFGAGDAGEASLCRAERRFEIIWRSAVNS